MDTLYSTTSHNFTLDENDETTTDNLSHKMNRSRQLLREFGNNMTNTNMNMSNVSLNQSLGQSLLRQKPVLFQQQQTTQSQSEPGLSLPLNNNKQYLNSLKIRFDSE